MGGAPRGRGGNPPVLKKFGQHFLNDASVLNAIVDALAPTVNDTVVEIGPGRGSLTSILAPRCHRLVAIEIDRALAAQLRRTYAGRPNVELVEADVLEVDIPAIAGSDYLLIGNVPYYITTPIIFKALAQPFPKRSVFLVQREVAERMSARENTDPYGALSINIGVVANVESVLDVPPTAFQPPPKVWSSVVKIVPRETPLVAANTLEPFRTFVQSAFSLRRKQMLRVLRSVRGISAETAGAVLESVGIDPSSRPETVSPKKFAELFAELSS